MCNDKWPSEAAQQACTNVTAVCVRNAARIVPLLRLQSSEGKPATSRDIEPVRRSFCRRGSCTFHGSGTFGAFWPLPLPQYVVLSVCFCCGCGFLLRAWLTRRGARSRAQTKIAQPRDIDLPNGACLTEHTRQLHPSGH